jgi:uncharacterized protein YjlB
MRLKTSRPDSPGQAMLARVESHINDQRRRAVWRDDAEAYHAYDGALETIRALQRQSHAEAQERRRSL